MELTSKESSENSVQFSPITFPPRPTLKPQTREQPKCIQKLTYLIIRPPRIRYDPQIIHNPVPFTHQMITYQIPFELTVYQPLNECRYCILYLHGNSSCRMEGMNMMKEVPQDVALACFDFEGCGNGNDPWVTLGIKQSKQANTAAKFLEERGYKVIGWGRSMGAASLLLSDIKIMVVDSAFSSLKQICTAVAQKQVKWMPNCLFCCLFSCVYGLVRLDFRDKTSQQIDKLSIIDHLKEDPEGQRKSAIFISGDQDTVIDSSHSKKLYEVFKGRKQLYVFKGTHNSTRNANVFSRCFSFIEKTFSPKAQDEESNCQLKADQQRYPGSPMSGTDQFPKPKEPL